MVTRYVRKALLPLVALALGGVLSGCGDSTGPSSLEKGRFEAKVSGVVTKEISGSATSQKFGGDDVIFITLFSSRGTSEQVLIGFTTLSGPFTKGSTRITDTQQPILSEVVGVVILGVAGGGRSFESTGGTLDIEEIRSDGIRGSATFTAKEIDPQTDARLSNSVTVNVSFNTRDS